ncbi:MAG: hypothetical protein K6E31_08955 [bacterium]|nr:hypothetical protein [bacterium]
MKTRFLFALVMMFFLTFPQIGFSLSAEEAMKAKIAASLLSGAVMGFTGDINLSKFGSLRDSDVGGYKIRLEADNEYLITGICDDDCKDLDLLLLDSGDKLIKGDVDKDDHPSIHITPKRTDTFTLGIKMSSCSVSPCHYGIIVMKK